MTFGGGLFLVAEDVLYLLHAEAALVEEGAAGVSGEVPVQTLCDAGGMAYLAEDGIGFAIAADGCKVLGTAILLQQLLGTALPQLIEGDMDGLAGLLLRDDEHVADDIM